MVGRTEGALQAAIEKYGCKQEIGWPDLTVFYLPMIAALTGRDVKTLADAPAVLQEELKPLLIDPPSEQFSLLYLPGHWNAGGAILMTEEIWKALGYLENTEPVTPGWLGFISDTIQRTLGIQLVDGRMPGFAALLGAAPDVASTVYIVRELQKRNLLIFLCRQSSGQTIRDELIVGGVFTEEISAIRRLWGCVEWGC